VYSGVSTAQLGNEVAAATTQSANGTVEFHRRLPDSSWNLVTLPPGSFGA
jgi:hypothetical protein